MTENIKEIIRTPIDSGFHNNIHYIVMVIYTVGKPIRFRMTEMMDEGIVFLLKNTTKDVPYPEEVIKGLGNTFPDSEIAVTLEQLKNKFKTTTGVAMRMHS